MSEFNIVIIGETGTGKSSLSDLLAGKDLFKVSGDPASCTKETICHKSEIDPSIGIVDTPGLQDSKGSDKEHYDQMIKIIKSLNNINLVVVVLNYASCRLTLSVQYMLRFLCYLFPKDISNHIAIVFTHYDDEYERSRAKKKGIENPRTSFQTKYIPAVKKVISEAINVNEKDIIIPTYFLDAEYIFEGKILEKDENTKNEMNILLSTAKMKSPIKTINDKANIKYKEEKEEFEERTENKEEGNKIITTTTKYKRIKYTNYDNSITYSDWEICGTPIIKEKEIENKQSSILDYMKIAQNVLDFMNKNNSSNGGGSILSSFFGSNDNTKDLKDNESFLSLIAEQVIQGKFGNGEDRKKNLKMAGFDYDKIQSIVNSKLKK